MRGVWQHETSGANHDETNQKQRGAALLETAITLPIVLLVSVGIFEFGRAYQTWQVLTNAAREGARIAVLARLRPTPQVTTAVQQVHDRPDSWPTPARATDRRRLATSPSALNTASRVTVNYPFEFMVLSRSRGSSRRHFDDSALRSR